MFPGMLKTNCDGTLKPKTPCDLLVLVRGKVDGRDPLTTISHPHLAAALYIIWGSSFVDYPPPTVRQAILQLNSAIDIIPPAADRVDRHSTDINQMRCNLQTPLHLS